MILGVLDIKNEAPQDAKEAYDMGVRMAMAVGEGIYWIHPQEPHFGKWLAYPLDEPDLHGPNRSLTPQTEWKPGPPLGPEKTREWINAHDDGLGTYTTIEGGTFGFGIGKYRDVCNVVGTEIYGPMVGHKLTFEDYACGWIKLRVAYYELSRGFRATAMIVNAFHLGTGETGEQYVKWLRHWRKECDQKNISFFFTYGWHQAKETIKEAFR